MIRPPGFRGAAFGGAAEGDGRADPVARRSIAAALGIPDQWAYSRQVHGTTVLHARRPGDQGAGDVLVTDVPGLPVAVATADCLPVVIEAEDAAAVVHAGWKGVAGGAVASAVAALDEAGSPPVRAAIGPAIGPCCFEVGPDVLGLLDGFASTTSWGTSSVDLAGAAAAQLPVPAWRAGACTRCGDGYHSWRRDRTRARQVTVAWLPER